jgi:hypothetical protein
VGEGSVRVCPERPQLGLAAKPKTTEGPELRLLINPQTGEVVEDERDILIHQLEAEKRGQSLQIGLLKKELRELRAVEPEAQHIKEVLAYWRERINPRAVALAPGGKRWEKVRARFRDNLDGRDSWTVEELKLAVDGALLTPWLNGTDPQAKGQSWLDAETIFKSDKQVERLRDTALGFKARTGTDIAPILDVMEQMIDVDWKLLLRVCMCDHRRVSHSLPDPNRNGAEGCLVHGCGCTDFDLDVYDSFNIKSDEHLARHFGRAA